MAHACIPSGDRCQHFQGIALAIPTFSSGGRSYTYTSGRRSHLGWVKAAARGGSGGGTGPVDIDGRRAEQSWVP